MIISTQTEALGRYFNDETAIRMIAAAGFDAADFSMFYMQDDDCPLLKADYREYVLRLKEIADECGLFFNQAHAPFPSCKPKDSEYTKRTFDKIVRAMETASMLGVKNIVVHPTNVSPEENFDYNIEFYNRLKPYCIEFGIKVALENMWGRDAEGHIVPNVCSVPDDFNRHLDALDSRYFTACLDIGHCGLVGDSAPNMIRKMGHDRIKALHVHDNNHIADQHVFPFSEKIDWAETMKALGEISYDGDLTFEADNSLFNMPKSFAMNGLKYLHEIGLKLVSMMENS
ncbi:MAG: sugar phosphate isomerase/epimerase [Clostridiales bacterium]|nr:sugar phosphate isomerase/epimerase [Clostridiales bacterium]